MAKRKSTDKTPENATEDQVDPTVSEASDPSETSESTGSSETPNDMDTAADAVDAVDAYAPKDEEADTEAKPDEPAPDADAQEPGTEIAAADNTDVTVTEEPVADADADAKETPDDHLTEDEAEVLIDDAETHHFDEKPSQPFYEQDRPIHHSEPQVIRETVVERKGGFVPMLIGGVVAAGLGYGAAAYVSQDLWPFAVAEDDGFETEMRDANTAQDTTLASLADRVSAIEGTEPPVVDLTEIETQLTALQSTTSDLTGRIDDLASRVDALERQPMEQAVSPEAIAAYERALDDLRAEVDAQRAEVEQMAQEAVQAEDNAEEQAALAASRAALAEVTAALETGSAFADALETLSANGVDVPDALSFVAGDGVATQGSLIESFPDTARDALSEARAAQTESAEGTSRVATFFQNQLGARSVAPREGDSADAVLSRAEASARAGDLDAALNELSALPEVAQTALADWRSRAETRLAAKNAADDLVQQLIKN